MKDFFDLLLDEHSITYSSFNSFEDFMSFLELELAYDEDKEELIKGEKEIEEIYLQNK